MSAPLVSIITPTREREQFLLRIAQCVLAQTVPWEWWVLDDSAAANPYMQGLAGHDPRVHYIHSPVPMSIGAKRNTMIAAAQAPHIAHFDDDDVYGPAYLEHMLGVLTNHETDMVKLSQFFLYAPACDFLGYIDLNIRTGWHYELAGANVTPVEFRNELQLGEDFIVFYGFSFVYRRDLALSLPYEDINLFEDARFATAWINRGHRLATTNRTARDCIRWVHPGATSRTYSSYRIPTFLMHGLFPFWAQLGALSQLTSGSST